MIVTSRRTAFAIAVAAVLAFSIAACGGGGGGDDSSDSSTGDGGSAVSSIFIEEADAICASAKKQVQGEFRAYLEEKKIKEPKTPAQINEVIETIGIPALRKQLTSLRALGAPGEEDKVNEYLDAVEVGIKKGEEEPRILFTSTAQVFSEADKIAGEIGLKVCGQR